MSPDPETDTARLRAIAMALPCAAEKLSHGMPFFYVEKGKGFAQYWPSHHQDGRYAVMVKTSGPEERALLIEADPALYYIPAYIGASGWIAIRTDVPETDWDHIADRVAASWRTVAPAKLFREHTL
jgi:hypothetical protein